MRESKKGVEKKSIYKWAREPKPRYAVDPLWVTLETQTVIQDPTRIGPNPFH